MAGQLAQSPHGESEERVENGVEYRKNGLAASGDVF